MSDIPYRSDLGPQTDAAVLAVAALQQVEEPNATTPLVVDPEAGITVCRTHLGWDHCVGLSLYVGILIAVILITALGTRAKSEA